MKNEILKVSNLAGLEKFDIDKAVTSGYYTWLYDVNVKRVYPCGLYFKILIDFES